jgi:hypothetical protein
MEGLKLWIKADNQFLYKIVVASDFIDGVNEGTYTAVKDYIGIDEHEGLFVLKFADKYIITNQIGDKIKVESNFLHIIGGEYGIDLTKKPSELSTIYKNNGIHLSIDSADNIVYYGSMLIQNNHNHEQIRYNRNGVLKTSQRVFSSPSFDYVNLSTYSNVTWLTTLDEFYAGIYPDDIEAAALDAFAANDYKYKFSPAENWSGWVSSSLTGEYQPFGGAVGTKTVGHFSYLDENENSYIKGFDITESDGEWSLTYAENGAIYKTIIEPENNNEDNHFINNDSEPSSIILTFDSYVTVSESILNVQIADDIT